MNKLVTLISTMHPGAAFNNVTGKPEVIMTYNATKGSVDTFDQLCQGMNCGRKTLCYFYNMINIACLNAFVINNTYRAGKETPMSRMDVC